MSVLDKIMGVREAAKIWGLSPDRVKGMCQRDEVKAKKIGSSWVLERNQSNPKKYRTSEPLIWDMSLKCIKTLIDEDCNLRNDYEERIQYIYEKTKSELGLEIADKLNKKIIRKVNTYKKTGAWDFR